MRLGYMAGYQGAQARIDVGLVQEAERLGYDVVWTAEAYGSDAVVPLAWMGAHTSKIKLGTAIMQIPARTPAMTAMTAMTLDGLSGGRMVLGLGMSGPQVVEGWHGDAYGKPLARTREFVAVVRQIFARRAPVEFDGRYYQIPYHGDDASGLGKPLKSILHARADMPIYIAAIGPKNLALAGEIADGVLPVFFSPDQYPYFEGALQEGFAKAPGKKSFARFDLAPMVHVALGDDLEACYDHVRPSLALYVGGMGARGQNFYNDLACRYGYEAEAKKIQDLFLDGKKSQAEAAVPKALIDEVALVGPRDRIKDRLSRYREIKVSTLNIAGPPSEQTLRTFAELVL
ncbi:MAG: LLM class F420-dependent oxidoreductase [Candidatus Lambdaproteobacteria bacterium]|nr:LLM class F420-dependent oxidoreductase [Candidatus Lambdaproteobacteria bacterium]